MLLVGKLALLFTVKTTGEGEFTASGDIAEFEQPWIIGLAADNLYSDASFPMECFQAYATFASFPMECFQAYATFASFPMESFQASAHAPTVPNFPLHSSSLFVIFFFRLI
ncbi:hypothetical protein A8L34_15650 [Bacillus sp. FJAT-27264]|nr:hypothetical protein A8L34_15650 [Bacillus sp. FJAT-27264]